MKKLIISKINRVLFLLLAALIMSAKGLFAQSVNTYEYDNLNRLTKVTFANGAVVQYTYDAVGNRLTKTVEGMYTQYTISASAAPVAGGTVTGAGSFQEGQTCTLTATANSDYAFNNWTENGNQVSTNATYSFTVTGNRTLIANFSYTGGGSDHEYVDLGLPSGMRWATCNVGANAPEEYGEYFAWGETQTKDTYNWTTYQYCMGSDTTLTKYCNKAEYGYNGFTDNLTVLTSGDDAASVYWGTGWRMPTIEEWQELFDNTTNTWTSQNGVNGRLFTAPNGNSIFLPAAGYRINSNLNSTGSSGRYYSSSLYTSTPSSANRIIFSSSSCKTGTYDRTNGLSIRPVNPLPFPVVSVTVNPLEGGVVSGAGTYADGTVCTLTATPNSGYTFINWTENGALVSTKVSYSFVVTGNRTLVANFALNGNGNGRLNGMFSVSDNQQVNFSRGNLQYQASTNTWRFAPEQWFYVGADNNDISTTNSGWIDLFGWGTSGHNHGAVCYQPWSTSEDNSDYYAYGNSQYNLYDQSGQADWGCNAISNGGNIPNIWRTPTHEEWEYVINTRTTASGIRYAKANVYGVNGLILLPDDWSEDYYSLSDVNTTGASFSSNTISDSQWRTLEQHGAVFLPAASYRKGTSVTDRNAGYYCSSSYWNDSSSPWYDTYVYALYFYPSNINPSYGNFHYAGQSVRLVAPYEETSYIIEVSANPTGGGTVDGGGAYSYGATCTLTATPNSGYSFVRWTKNGSQVSTDATYSFTVTEDASYVAEFVSGTPSPHWDPQQLPYSETMALNGVIHIDGVEQYSNLLEVGVFCGDECRGSSIASEFFITNRYLVMISVSGEAGNVLTFKLYDHAIGQELDLTPPESLSFTEDGYGTMIEPYVLNFISSVAITATTDPEEAGTVNGTGDYAIGASCTLTATANEGYQFSNWTRDGEVVSTASSFTFTVTGAEAFVAHFQCVQTQPLIAGWNWWSTYVEQEGVDGLEMLENSIGTAGVRIQSKNNGYVDRFDYNGTSYWYGTLQTLTNEQMYKVRTSASCEAAVAGDVTQPTNHPISINNGWNWIGFPSNQPLSVEAALNGFTPEPNDQIKSKNNGYVNYISYNGYNLWYGTLNTLIPGQGYMYKSNSSSQKTLVFQAGRGGATPSNITTESNVFIPKEEAYADNMTITAVVELEGTELRSEDFEVAAFAGSECRGSAKLMYVEPLDRYMAFLLVAGDNEQVLRFVLTDGRSTCWSDDCLTYTTDGVTGIPTEPAVLHFGPMGLEEDGPGIVIVYPNPSKNVFNINGTGIRKLEVINTYGQVILSKEIKGDHISVDLGNYAAGTYLLRVITDNGITMKQLIRE